jgi:hypothetical protein
MPITKKKVARTAAKTAKKAAAKKAPLKKAAAKKGAAVKKTAATHHGPPADTKVRVRMYRQGLGDCFLITFYTAAQPIHMLIDCGSVGEQTTQVTLADVGNDIVNETNGRLAMLVATHEHQDHVNGFLRNQALFDAPGFKIDRVWLAWTEDASDELAQEIEKFEHDLLAAVALTSEALTNRGLGAGDFNKRLSGLLEFVGDLPAGATVFGAGKFAKTVDAAMNWVTNRASNHDKFLSPGRVLEPSWLPGIRVYVLGPPRDRKRINTLGAHGDPNLYELTAQISADFATCATFAMSPAPFADYRAGLEGDARATFERRLPFDPRFRIEAGDDAMLRQTYAAYFDAKEDWRRIDTDWLAAGGSLALQLDNATNNTSLVLAFELIEDGRVLLFAADAQLGSWLSWDEHKFEVTENGTTRDVSVAQLLDRTVLYKVGHHSSHNATTKAKGLERMKRADLVAMIPLDGVTAENKWEDTSWPAKKLFTALCKRTVGRVLRSDTGWPKASDRPSTISQTKWNAARKAAEDNGVVVVDTLYIDYHLV